MIRILFICHGNTCRSPMAEFIMKDLVRKAGLENRFEIASAATSSEDVGLPVNPNSVRELNARGISCKGKRARQITPRDYDNWDMLIAMEPYNISNMLRIIPDDPEGKMSLLLSFAGEDRGIDDPWYYGNYPGTYLQIEKGCRALLEWLKEQGKI